jgi:hypothetical protein
VSCYRNRGFKSPAPTKRGGLQNLKAEAKAKAWGSANPSYREEQT